VSSARLSSYGLKNTTIFRRRVYSIAEPEDRFGSAAPGLHEPIVQAAGCGWEAEGAYSREITSVER
jgi:hypothetical protein